jgi:hypothetical protein
MPYRWRLSDETIVTASDGSVRVVGSSDAADAIRADVASHALVYSPDGGVHALDPERPADVGERVILQARRHGVRVTEAPELTREELGTFDPTVLY